MSGDGLRVCVLGAGVVGLTAARMLQEHYRGAALTVIADEFNDTTSHVAAGIFLPRSTFRGYSQEITQKWIVDSYDYWYELMRSRDAAAAGVAQLSAYMFSNRGPIKNKYIEDVVPVYRDATEDELNLCGGSWKYGTFMTTLIAECELYLPWISSKIKNDGGKFLKMRISNIAELQDKYHVVLNCTGLGARYLFNDDEVVPIRGQVIKVKAPWVKTAFYGDNDPYIIPGFNGNVTLGGTRQYESSNTQVCKHDAAAIMERCSRMLPGLKNAEVLGHKVGLRPHRDVVRVEAEAGARVRLVHCYGHGGYGVTTAPGTASHAIRIAHDLLRTNLRNKL